MIPIWVRACGQFGGISAVIVSTLGDVATPPLAGADQQGARYYQVPGFTEKNSVFPATHRTNRASRVQLRLKDHQRELQGHSAGMYRTPW